MPNIDAKYLRTILSIQGLAKISDLGSAKASATEKAEIDKLSPSEKAERLFSLGVERISQEELLAIIQKFPKVYSFSPEDDGKKPEDLSVLTTAELEAKLAEGKKITDVIREALTGEVASGTPVITTLAEALAFAERIKRESLQRQLDADLKNRNQLVMRALGLDGKRSERDMVDVVCADCGATAPVPATLDLTRPVFCRACLPKHRQAKNKPGT